MSTQLPAVGHLLRDWRRRRRLSQLDLACEAEISSRHLSFVETGRSQPSREMVMRLSRNLDIPLRERNTLLVAAGYAPVFKERAFNDPPLAAASKIVDLILTGHEPYPALAVDRHWTMLAANRTVAVLLAGVETSLLQPPVNVLRLTLHPGGLADRIANLPEWRSNLLARLRRQVEVSADPVLASLFDELVSYGSPEESEIEATDYGSLAVPFRLTSDLGVLSFLSTTTVFGTPVDITLSELALESFFPADAFTIEALNRLLQSANSH